jgi:type I restriction enzyme, S subunit
MRADWQILPFEEVISDETGGNIKTQQADFQTEGHYPIIDQGKALIAGYTDDQTRVCKARVPVIVFGDHTRSFKFVDFPFCLGADGTKILRPRIDADTKYLFHYLRQIRIPDAGYDRHFKYLKRADIWLPPLDEQRRIAAILDQADELRRKREQTLALLDDLSRSIFIVTFGDLRKNPHGWETKRLAEVLNAPLRNGVSPSNTGTVPSVVLTLSAITGSAFDCNSVKKALFESGIPHDKRVSRDDLLICRGNGNLRLVGKGYFPSADMSEVAFPDTVIAARVSTDQMIPKFLEWLWNSEATRAQIQRSARTTNGTYKINQTALQSIEVIVPPLHLQEDFASKITSVDKLKWLCVTHLAKLEKLFASLRHRAFRGELASASTCQATELAMAE